GGVGQQVAVRERGALGPAGGAGGVGDDGHAVLVDLGRRRPGLGGGEVVEGRAAAAGAFHPDAGRRAEGGGRLVEAVGQVGVDGHGGAAGVADDPGELVRQEPDVEGDDGGPELDGGDGQRAPAHRVV